MEILATAIIEFDLTKSTLRHLNIDDLPDNFRNDKMIYWIHCDLNDKKIFHEISQKLRLPEKVIEVVCSEENNMPKLSDTEVSLTMQIQCLLTMDFASNDQASFGNLIIHLTNNYCLTASYESIPALIEFYETCQKAIRFAKTPCFILFLVCDNVINDYSKILFNMEILIEEMDLQIRDVKPTLYNELVLIKQQVMKIKRNTIAMREILVRISDRKLSVVSEQCRVSLYNLSNHTHMVAHETDSLRDILNSLLSQIDNTLMQNLNQTMRVLTAFAAIFLPLSLITGIYGMNFQWIPELHWKYGYFYALTLLIICAGVLLFIFKKNKWF